MPRSKAASVPSAATERTSAPATSLTIEERIRRLNATLDAGIRAAAASPPKPMPTSVLDLKPVR